MSLRCLGAALVLGLAPSAHARPLPLPSLAALARSTAIVRFHERRQHVPGGFAVALAPPAGARSIREERGVTITPGPIAPPSHAERRAGLRWRQLFWFHARAVRHRPAGGVWSRWERPGDVPIFGCLVRLRATGRDAVCIDVPLGADAPPALPTRSGARSGRPRVGDVAGSRSNLASQETTRVL